MRVKTFLSTLPTVKWSCPLGDYFLWDTTNLILTLATFVVSDERIFRHLNFTFGSSRIASSAYQKWPTSVGTFECPCSIK